MDTRTRGVHDKIEKKTLAHIQTFICTEMGSLRTGEFILQKKKKFPAPGGGNT